MTTDTVARRVRALKGTLVGDRVRVRVPYRVGEYAEIGTVSAVAFPLVEVDVGGGEARYRHIDRIELIDSH